MTILSVKDLSYSYPGSQVPVLKDLNLEFELGKVYAIMGKSGAGKTTLLSLISGLTAYQSGEISYKDKSLKAIDRERYRSNDVGIIFQSYNLILHLNAIENVVLGLSVSKKIIKDVKSRALEMLKKVNLSEDKAKRRILKLSGGEQQRVAIARAIAYDPEVIIADEPTGNLDGETEQQVLDILKRIAHDDQKCVIIVTHSQHVAKQSDVIYHL